LDFFNSVIAKCPIEVNQKRFYIIEKNGRKKDFF
jgi:hypothetical protein